MDSRTYSVGELLELRHTQFPGGMLQNLTSNRDIDAANIVRDQGNKSLALPQPVQMANGDISSSTESDEVLFRGNVKAQTKWKYRGRTEAEYAKDEPLKAPTGLGAQQSEGFKKFYKAVVSPTHVRVTAGGKIVPNTRGSPSPTAKWEKGHPSVVGQESFRAASESKSRPSAHVNGQMAYQPLMPHSYLGHPGIVQHMGLPMPIYHMQPMAYGMQPLQFIQPGINQAASDPMQKDASEDPKTVRTQDGAGDKKPRPAPIKIAPLDQYDPNRPFYYNGNVIFPSPYGPGQPMTLPSPYYAFGQMGSMSQPSPFGTGASPAFTGQGSVGKAHRPWQQPQSAPNPNMGPHITSIRPSEVTKRQLDHMRKTLRHFEDQLQYNKHQIDEKTVAEQIEKIQQNVAEFEQKYKNQVEYEMTRFSQTPPDLQTPSGHSSRRSRRRLRHAENISEASSVSGFDPSSTRSPLDMIDKRPRFKNEKLKGIGINYTTGILEPFAPEDPALEKLIKSVMEKPLETPASSSDAGVAPQPEGAAPRTYGPAESQPYHMFSTGQSGTGYSTPATHERPASASFNQGGPSQPYLVGKLPHGMNAYEARPIDYVYDRQLTEEEKQAREKYWGKVSIQGTGLPKFDGQNFYPPSPAKAFGQRSLRLIPTGQPSVDYKVHSAMRDIDPFDTSSRSPQIYRPKTGGQKLSKAIPIVAPKDGPKSKTSRTVSQGIAVAEGSGNAAKLSEEPISEKKNGLGRREIERSSNKSGSDLLQSMLKKASTSSTVLPSAVSSTTATGYLPPYQGNAAASLGPSVSNANSPGTRALSQAGDKPVEHDSPQSTAEKVGENCPPSEARSAD
ncbi:hypothetical protein GGR52DRAFT_28251 [Hypoxylon sp. FL1284]|nr:hypothetical protein GGR52DRAFT_28251 [Hypoxylon sp. FL1284]